MKIKNIPLTQSSNYDILSQNTNIKGEIMTDIILKETEGSQTMDSREIAELTGKLHKNVMRDIRKQLEQQELDQLRFESVELDKKGEERPCFKLDYDQTMILVSGYSIPLRAKIVKRWRQLELEKQGSYLIQDPIERAKQWIVEQEEKQQLLLANKAQDKRVHRLIHNSRTYTATQLAKELGFGSATAFNRDLHAKGIIFKDIKGVWHTYREYSERGFTDLKNKEVTHKTTGEPEIKYYMQWTGLGRDYILGLYSNNREITNV